MISKEEHTLRVQEKADCQADYYQGKHTARVHEALPRIHGEADECVGAGAGVRAVKTDGV